MIQAAHIFERENGEIAVTIVLKGDPETKHEIRHEFVLPSGQGRGLTLILALNEILTLS